MPGGIPPGKTIATADVRDADALIVRTRTRCDAALLEGSSVKLIATATIGFDHIDTEYCRRHGIEVATAAGCNARGVLQYVAAALVRLSRVQAWEPADKTLGIVGVGHVGSLVEAYARTWDSASWHAIPREEREHGGFPAARRGGVPGRHPHLPHPLDDTTRHGRGEALRANEARQHPHQHFARRGSRWGRRSAKAVLQYVLDVWEHEPDLDPLLLRDALLATLISPVIPPRARPMQRPCPSGRSAGTSDCRSAEWYPSNIAPSRPRAISWQELCDTIDDRFDIAAESRRLKENPENSKRYATNTATGKNIFNNLDVFS